jgi:hypothetical protein
MTHDEIIEMARQAGLHVATDVNWMPIIGLEYAEKLIALARADEREACAHKVEEFARKWWKINCDSNLHYSSTLRAHQDFCALQAAIRARGEQA